MLGELLRGVIAPEGRLRGDLLRHPAFQPDWLRDWLRDWADAVRRNHGLEHATVTILLARRGPTRLAGRATTDGFYIIGEVDEALLDQSAHDALARMKRGEAALAVSPLCGTNIAVTGALTAALVMFSLSRTADRPLRERYGNAFTVAMLGTVAAQPLGRLVQKYITTRGDVDRVEIVGIRTLLPGVRKVITTGAAERASE